MSAARNLRRWLSGRTHPASEHTFRDLTLAYEQTRLLVRCYYAVFPFVMAMTMYYWPHFFEAKAPDPLWPVAWLPWLSRPELGISALLTLFCIGSFLVAFFPHKRSARLLACVGILAFVALKNSYGKIGHSYHLFVLTSFVLIFLPSGWEQPNASRERKQSFLLNVWGCQAILLLTYTMSGCGKLLGSIGQISRGEAHCFSPSALARHIAARNLRINEDTLLGGQLIEYYWLGWPLMLGMLYLEFFAIWAAFRPAIRRFWAVGLISFHVGAFVLMGISFPRNVFLVALFFIALPPPRCYGQGARTWRQQVSELPLFGFLRSRGSTVR